MKKKRRVFQVNGIEYTLPSNAAVAVGRFDPDGVKGYKANNLNYDDAPLRATRAEAEQDYIAFFTKAEGK